jgi:hypothetical protein
MMTIKDYAHLETALTFIYERVKKPPPSPIPHPDLATLTIFEAFKNLSAISTSDWMLVKKIRKELKSLARPSLHVELVDIFLQHRVKAESKRRKANAPLTHDLVDIHSPSRNYSLKKSAQAIVIVEEYMGATEKNNENPPPLLQGRDEQLLSRISNTPLPEEQQNGILARQANMKEIGKKFLSNYGPLLIENLLYVATDVLKDETKKADILDQLKTLFSKNGLSNCDTNSIEQFNTLILPDLLVSNIQCLKNILKDETKGPTLMNVAMDLITPVCFKKPDGNPTFRKHVVIKSIKAIHSFVQDLNTCLSELDLSFEKPDELFEGMAVLLQKRVPFSQPMTLEGLRNLIRNDIKECLLLKNGTNSNHTIQLIVSLLPYLFEHLLSRLAKRHTIYTFASQALRFYSEQAQNDPQDEFCHISSTFVKNNTSQTFSTVVADQLFNLLEEILKVPTLSVQNWSSVVGWLKSYITPKLVAEAKKMEKNLCKQSDSVCVFLPFNLINNLFFNRATEEEASSENLGLFQKTDEQKTAEVDQLEQEIRDKIDLKFMIENTIDNSSYRIFGWIKKKVVPTTLLNEGIQTTLSGITQDERMIYLLISHIFNGLKAAIRNSPT